ncbi:PadR family transcriptional regulator [Klebsiella quasipneumoniae]|nr:Transcriptional regulator PadR-like family [Klebsiella pneumoniae]
MTDKDLYGGMIRLHILHHAAKEPVFGLGIIEELRHHGYQLSPGTLYPMLHGMEKKGISPHDMFRPVDEVGEYMKSPDKGT